MHAVDGQPLQSNAGNTIYTRTENKKTMITTNPIPYGVPNSKATTGWPAPEEDPSTSRAYETRCTKEAKNKMAAKGKMGAWWW